MVGGRRGPAKGGEDPRFGLVHRQGRHRVGHADRGIEKRLPKATVAADSFYGNDKYFRGEVTELGLEYAVGIHENLKVQRLLLPFTFR